MEKYIKQLKERKYGYNKNLELQNFNKSALSCELNKLFEMIDATNGAILSCENKLTELEDTELAIEVTKEDLKKDLKTAIFIVFLTIGSSILFANAFSNLAITIFLFYVTNLTVLFSTLPLLKYPIKLSKLYKNQKEYNKSELSESLEIHKQNLIDLILEVKTKQKQIDRLDEIIKPLENIISKIDDEIIKITYARNNADRKTSAVAPITNYIKPENVTENVGRLERVRKNDNKA